MTDGFLWGGFNIRKFCRIFFGNLWMVIVVMIITYLGLGIVEQKTYTPYYQSKAVVAVYPKSTYYRYHTIETVLDISSKTNDVNTVLNSELFQSGLNNQDPSLKEWYFQSMQVTNTDLLILHSFSNKPEVAIKGIWAALDYYSRFSGDMTGAPEIKIIFGPEAPIPVEGSSKIHNKRPLLSVLSGLMMAGLLFFMYVIQKTYKTERSIRKRYKNIRFFSLPCIKSGFKFKKRIFSKRNVQEPIRKLALEIRQVLHKNNKSSLLVVSYADLEGKNKFISELAEELTEQKEDVIVIGTKTGNPVSIPGLSASDESQKYTLQDVLQQKCTVEDAMLYNEEFNGVCIQWNPDGIDENVSYSVDDVKRVLTTCTQYADIVLVNGAVWYPSYHSQIWKEAVDASIAFCPQVDAEFFKVDQMLRDLQKGDTYFAGCVLLGF